MKLSTSGTVTSGGLGGSDHNTHTCMLCSQPPRGALLSKPLSTPLQILACNGRPFCGSRQVPGVFSPKQQAPSPLHPGMATPRGLAGNTGSRERQAGECSGIHQSLQCPCLLILFRKFAFQGKSETNMIEYSSSTSSVSFQIKVMSLN